MAKKVQGQVAVASVDMSVTMVFQAGTTTVRARFPEADDLKLEPGVWKVRLEPDRRDLVVEPPEIRVLAGQSAACLWQLVAGVEIVLICAFYVALSLRERKAKT